MSANPLLTPDAELTAFNARWMTPREVAQTFIPTPHLNALMKTQHSLLLGPRGCGKTTLLKMLTRQAQEVWSQRIKNVPSLDEYPRLNFEAIYIPSDVRWAYELKAIRQELPSESILAERVQRAAVSISGLIEAVNVFESLLGTDTERVEDFLTTLIRKFQLRNTVPIYSDIRLSLSEIGDVIRSSIVRRDLVHLTGVIDNLHPSLTAHAADAIIRASSIFQEFFPHISSEQRRWALCFDELEIAPKWLQSELLRSLRSSKQNFLLKLTWSPVLPIEILTDAEPNETGGSEPDLAEPDIQQKHQQPQHDFETIKMWNPHASDSQNVSFCKRFSSHFIQSKFRNRRLTPRDVFGSSVFAQEDRVKENDDVYAHGSPIWHSMVELAKRDMSFHMFLKTEGLNPEDPVSDQVRRRDECLRKIKPIVLLRETYRGTQKARSRKRPTLYAGEEAIYAISEGNPRLLARLLNELLDDGFSYGWTRTAPVVRKEHQAKILAAASRRALSGIKAYPTQNKLTGVPHLSKLVDFLGKYLHNQLVLDDFPGDDPVGSFFVDERISEALLQEISRGLLIGAFIAVGAANEIPSSIVGARIRLSYILAPHYKLLFRNYRQIRLTNALKASLADQPRMF